MGAQKQRGAYSWVCGASTAKRPAALGYAGAGPAQRATGSRLGDRTRDLFILVLEFLAEFDELALEGFEAVGDRVGHVGVIHRRLGDALPPFRLNDPGRHADDRGVRRDRLQYDGVGPDLDVIADLDPAEDLGAGAHHHMIAQRWMALAALLAGASYP